eukprot:GFUD01073740.1.p1 GENE.GFUD01073740.1~~GFUD01073740.1.p1  ORF type:complete len:105 (-),score=22.93 GFUD01073740.1:39-353(-)
MLDEQCYNDEECKSSTNHTVCLEVTPTSSYCKCTTGYQAIMQSPYTICTPLQSPTPSAHLSPLASLALGLVLLAGLLAFMLKLFSRARNVPKRERCVVHFQHCL